MHPTLEKLLTLAVRRVQVLGALAPRNAVAERQRLTAALEVGGKAEPAWEYVPVAHEDLRRALDAASDAREVLEDDPLGGLVLARIRELSLEAALCAAAGTREIAGLSEARYPAPPNDVAAEVGALCDAWLAEDAASAPEELLASDADDARSLASRLRAEVGRLRLPFSVVVQPTLAPLAATGDGVLLVASGRPLSVLDVERTVLHEIEGHVLPRVAATHAAHPLFRIGTASGIDDQEGRAVLLEARAGLLGPRRRRQLAARHRAVLAMRAGATFHDVATSLVAGGTAPADAVLVTERAFRGGDGRTAGLGRERVYLEALVKVRAALVARPEDEATMASGHIAIDAVPVLREHLGG